MSNLRPLVGPPPSRMPTPPKGEPIARYDTYLEAQRAVDFLSDNHFPVQAVTIVGTGLQMVERVTGRLTYARVALAGAASGAWFGLIFGIVLSLFGGTDGAVLAGPLFGAAAGVLFGVFSYSLTRGRRDFTSASQIVASEYAVLCLAEQADAARQLIRQLPGGAGLGHLGAGGQVTPPPGPWGGPPPTNPYAPPPSAPPATSVEAPTSTESAQQPAQQPAEPPAGLTYGEAIELQRRERERVERERVERERLEREGR